MEPNSPIEQPFSEDQSAWRSLAAAFALGVTSLVTQVILLREFLAVFYGNELVVGSLLANWMVLTGIGSWLGRYAGRIARSSGILVVLLLLLAVLPFLTVAALRIVRNVVFPVGTMVDLVSIIWSSFLLLVPYCVVAGASFTLLASSASRSRRANMISSIYGLEAMGSVAGGLIFSLALIHILNTFQALTALLAFNVLAAMAVSRENPRMSRLIWVGAIFVLIPAFLLDVDTLTRRFIFPGQNILQSNDSPYGNLTVTEQGSQKNFFENNTLLSSTQDITGSEESVHYAMSQRDGPKRVLMISGGATGAPEEVLKYGVERLDYVELNPHIIQTIRQFTHVLEDRRINVVNDDARLFLGRTSLRYDVILLNAPEPSSVQTNRYYTVEFFERAKAAMSDHGVLSVGLLASTEYQSDHARKINSTLMQTLLLFFQNVLIVPGLKTYFLASDGPLDIHIGGLIEQHRIATTYVNQYYLEDADLSRRSKLLHESLDSTAAVNTDFTPVSYYRHLHYWLSFFRSGYWLVGLIALVLLVPILGRANSVTAGIISGGFAASCIEILLLIAFQTFYGYVYQVLGIIITIFMAGLSTGALARTKIVPHVTLHSYGWIQIGITAYCLVLATFMVLSKNMEASPVVMHAAIFVLTFGIAALVGLEFSAAAVLRTGDVPRVASELYSMDLLGSALGAFLVATCLIPTLGLAGVSLLVALLSFLTGLLALGKSKGYAFKVGMNL